MDSPPIEGQTDIYGQLALRAWAEEVAGSPVLLPLLLVPEPVPPAVVIPDLVLRTPGSLR